MLELIIIGLLFTMMALFMILYMILYIGYYKKKLPLSESIVVTGLVGGIIFAGTFLIVTYLIREYVSHFLYDVTGIVGGALMVSFMLIADPAFDYIYHFLYKGRK